ncbi:MAG: glycoside hydrolase family 20 zincin-like fold domain-containing protein, partial [Prevotella sp.]|nr:glycoside hydrolase family 20 zincin-like fold domain-containing protein [Prevotella sp.]
MKKVLLLSLLCASCMAINAAERFVTFSKTANTQLLLTGTNDTIVYDSGDWEGVKIAINNLKQDLTSVTGSACAPIEVGTVGRSKVASRYKSICKLLKGKWEQYVITADNSKLVVIGSDKRGTIYGIYELSRQMGVSPWYWMAEVSYTHLRAP